MKPTQTPSIHYEIRLDGCLAEQWTEWFEGLSITLQNGETLLSGPVADQSALYSLLRKVRDLSLPLVSVNRKPVHLTKEK